MSFVFAQIAGQKLKRKHLYPLGTTLLAVPHSRATRAVSDPHLQSQQLIQQNSFLHSNSFLTESQKSGGAILSRQKRQSKPAARQPSIYVALMGYEGDVLKPVRRSSLPLKVEVSSNHNDLKDAAIKKRKAFDRTFNAERRYVWHIRMQGLPGKSLGQTRILY